MWPRVCGRSHHILFMSSFLVLVPQLRLRTWEHVDAASGDSVSAWLGLGTSPSCFNMASSLLGTGPVTLFDLTLLGAIRFEVLDHQSSHSFLYDVRNKLLMKKDYCGSRDHQNRDRTGPVWAPGGRSHVEPANQTLLRHIWSSQMTTATEYEWKQSCVCVCVCDEKRINETINHCRCVCGNLILQTRRSWNQRNHL